MTAIDPRSAIAAVQDRDAQLRQAARQLEGVFVEHLFKAMRDTIPEGGLIDGGAGEEIFTSLLDRDLADRVAAGWERGLGEAIYRQLRATITDGTPATDTSPQAPRGG
jgi:peptidoglycan hydrolase FlgJ